MFKKCLLSNETVYGQLNIWRQILLSKTNIFKLMFFQYKLEFIVGF